MPPAQVRLENSDWTLRARPLATSSIGTRLKDLELDVSSHAAKCVEVLKDGVESCSLDVVDGVLHLSNATFLMHENRLAAVSFKNTPLLYDKK